MATDAENPQGDDAENEVDARGGRPSLVLGLVSVALLAAAAGLWLAPGFGPAPPRVGSPPPPARFSRLADGDQRLVAGIEGRVTWLVFLSVESPEGLAVLPRLEAAWNRLRPSGRFAMVAAAVDPPAPERRSATVSGFEGKGRMPLYRADRDARRVFGIDRAEPPWHFLVDPRGRIAAVARGAGAEMIDRLTNQAGRWLDAMAPLDASFFAWRTDVVSGPGQR